MYVQFFLQQLINHIINYFFIEFMINVMNAIVIYLETDIISDKDII